MRNSQVIIGKCSGASSEVMLADDSEDHDVEGIELRALTGKPYTPSLNVFISLLSY